MAFNILKATTASTTDESCPPRDYIEVAVAPKPSELCFDVTMPDPIPAGEASQVDATDRHAVPICNKKLKRWHTQPTSAGFIYSCLGCPRSLNRRQGLLDHM